MRPLLALAMLALLVGCAGLPEHAAVEPSMEAPRWSVGDVWIHRGVNLVEGMESLTRTEVVAIDDVHGKLLYRVRVTGNFTGSPQELYYDMDLNGAWAKWGSPCGSLPGGEGIACTGGERWFQWPVREGSEWEAREGGDVIEGAWAVATRANAGPHEGAPSFTITFRDRSPTGMQARLVTLSPQQGWYTHDVRYDDQGVPQSASFLVHTTFAPRGGPRATLPCGHGASFEDRMLFDALAEARAGTFEREQWAPSLPYENETLRARWRDFSLFVVGRTYGQVADVPTSLSVRPRGEALEIVGGAEANVTEEEMRARFVDFARDVLEAEARDVETWADAFIASKHASAYREGTPGNATPHGKGPFREYEEGPVYGYSYDVTVPAPARVQALLDAMPPLEAWEREDAETGRMLYAREGWSLWFEQPRHHLTLRDVRVTAFPTGEAYVMVTARLSEAEAQARVAAVFEAAALPAPPRLALVPHECGV